MSDGTPHLRTAGLAAASGYSVQQVRDLERLGVIPPADRAANNYRRFTERHLLALRAYRGLAVAVGPVVARRVLRDAWTLPLAEAAAAVSALHVTLAKERDDALAALSALRAIQAEAGGQPGTDDDAMSITQLADALGVRASTLRYWEQEGLVAPDRVTSYAARHYPPGAIREARITAALRAAGYRIPDVRRTIDAVRRLDDLADPVDALRGRLDAIARRTVALLDAGADLTRLLTGGR
ncbi:MerR family transcriptional regulator [Actinocatenispora rupis]|uniref:HTH merR-type domain-containing protein n=1 Tax=Actinocatenispora rupis TaxID=519421 RepID=A0A8J3NAC6_9ACTN|nr:MerR family transcriptional regulator [Actinocatenispora rupis]GID12229.1 hypothetical protein Aru02nite_31180 [Actinocatenispora rupis]